VTVMGSLIVLVNKRADWNVPVSYIKYMSSCSACGFSTKKNIKSKHNFESGHFQTQAHFSQLFCLQVRSVTLWQSHDRKSRCLRGKRHSSILYSPSGFFFDVSSSFYFWNVNRTPTWHLSKMFKVAFKDVSTKNSEPTYWTILFVMLKICIVISYL
jgi:hypothetical protein